MTHWIRAAAAGLVVALGACSHAQEVPNNQYADYRQYGQGQSSVLGDSPIFKFGKNNDNADQGATGLGVNAFLWRGALDTLSFMPLASADPFGGVIITDWYQPPNGGGGERFKATAYILGRQLRADGIRISIYRQVQQGGQWVDAPVSQATVTDIENKVLARARELRIQSAGG